MESDAHQKIDSMKGGKKKKHRIERPLADAFHLKENGLEEKEQKSYPDHFSRNHHEEMWPVGHTPHKADFDEEKE